MHVIATQDADAEAMRAGLREVGRVLSNGGLVVFPTETVYGIGCAAASDAGCAALRRFKARPEAQPFTIHVADRAEAERYVDAGIPLVRRALRRLLPGPVTLVVEVDDATIDSGVRAAGRSTDLRERLYHARTVGLRCPDHPVARQVLAAVDGPVLASSANPRGAPPPQDAAAAAAAAGSAADLVVDGGTTRYAQASSIVRIGKGPSGVPCWQLLRAGVYDERTIHRLMRWTLLLVCSGNTCRSPMAEVLARRILARRRGIHADDLDAAGTRVLSAGASAAGGAPATTEAVQAMAGVGLDLTRHRSRMLTPQLLREADLIYCMSASHEAAVLRLEPAAAGRTERLDPGADIDDPIGDGAAGYRRCADLIERRLEQRLSAVEA